MEMEFSTREKLVGAFVVITMILVTLSVIVVGRGKAWFSDHASYHIVFEEGYNLTEGARVKILNTDVGQVRSIKITPEHKVGVDIEILKKYADLVRQDSVAVVDSPTVIGSEYIAITAGSTNKPLIHENGLITSKRKKSLGEYAEEFHLEEKFNAMTRILNGLEQTVDQLKDPAGPMLGTMWDMRRVMNDVRQGRGAGNLLVKDDFYKRLDDQITHVEAALVNFEKTSKEVQQTSENLPATMQELRNILAELKVTSENAKAITQNIKAASKDIPVVTRGIRGNVRSLDQILDSTKRNPFIKGGIPEKADGLVHPDIRGAR